ncbi:hypothetical protein [Mycolicibacterium sp.]|uniref:hypothetical protein n=3 Tax=Mycolicibacterium sp. TaxID=2320850 RepID=UPI003D150987
MTTLTREWLAECVGYCAEYLRQLSGGTYQLAWQVYDWYELPMTSADWNNAGMEVWSTARPLVETGLNVNLSTHTHVAFVIDKNDARSAAWNSSGKPYLYISGQDFSPALLQHELGHMVGAKHAQAITGDPVKPDPYGDSFCVMAGEGQKFRFVEESLDFRWRLGQPEWQRCLLCDALFFGGNPTFAGVCPGAPLGSGHQGSGTDYVVAFQPNGPGDLRYCGKCAAMFRPGAANTCAAGGAHDAFGWFFTVRPATDADSLPQAQRQNAWFTCGKCQALFHDGAGELRRCAAGGDHAAAGAEGLLLHDVPRHNMSGPGMTLNNLVSTGWVKLTSGLNVSDVIHRRPHAAGFQIDALTTAPALGDFAYADNVAGGRLSFEYRHPSGWDRALPLSPDSADGWVTIHLGTEAISTLLLAKMPAKAGHNIYLEPLQAHVNISSVTATDTQRHVTVYVDTLDPPPHSQLNWRHCRKCRCLFYSGYLGKGPCPVGGEHEVTGPNFAIPHDVDDGGERDWRFCPQCQCMFNASAGLGWCVVGAPHVAAGFNFSLPLTGKGRVDGNWRRCGACECLVHIGPGAGGTCPVGGSHRPGDVRYLLPMPKPKVEYDRNAVPLDVMTKAGNPGPWIDQVHYRIENAVEANGIQNYGWMHNSLEDAAYLYDEMLRINIDAHGPQLAGGIIRALGLIGVNFSVPENDLRDWLANPLFTPYPAIAQALLLSRRRMKAPIFLDVISFKYEFRAGSSPRIFADVAREAFQAAILDAWNENYGENVVNIDDIAPMS